MFTTRWQLFRLSGIPIRLDLSWLIVLLLVTGSLAQSYYPQQLPGRERAEYWALGLVTALAFFGCIVLHEMGHALAARRLGMKIEGITLFLFGGVAELGGEPPSASAEFLMAIAGPAVSAVLAAGFRLLGGFGDAQGWPASAVVFCHYLGGINALVLAFNLVPAFPLDGGRVLRSALWGWTGNLRRATRWASALGRGFAWLLILIGALELFSGDVLSGIWLGVIGMFLNEAARETYHQLLLRQALAGEPVRRFMNAEPIVVPPGLSLDRWVEDYVYRFHRKAFPVASNGRLEGFITTAALGQFPRGDWPRHTVAEAMRQDLSEVTVSPDTDALRALARMQQTGLSRLLVTERDRLVGIVSAKDLSRFLQLKIHLDELNPEPPASV